MKHATLRQLKVFASVARHLSFARAAEELHLTQPAVSGQIRKLEEHAGVPLFEQLGKKTHLTAAGADLLGIVRSIVEQFEVAENAMTQHRGVSGGRAMTARSVRLASRCASRPSRLCTVKASVTPSWRPMNSTSRRGRK